jgi:O-antigen biosynthesis protein
VYILFCGSRRWLIILKNQDASVSRNSLDSAHMTTDIRAFSTGVAFGKIVSSLAFREPDRLPRSAWLGHIPFAFWLIEQLKPQVVVELGTDRGASYLAFCQAVQILNLPTRCYAIDTWLGDIHTGPYDNNVYEELAEYHNARYARFSSLLRKTFDQALDDFEIESVDLLHIDGTHTYEAVSHDFNNWLPKLSDRAVVLLHDTNVDLPNFGVTDVWAELTESYKVNCEFLHSCGLGVLAVGTRIPTSVREFFDIASTTEGIQLIRGVYSRLGGYCTGKFESELHRDELAK